MSCADTAVVHICDERVRRRCRPGELKSTASSSRCSAAFEPHVGELFAHADATHRSGAEISKILALDAMMVSPPDNLN